MNQTFLKRTLCLLLSAVMIVGLYPFSIVSAESALPTPTGTMGEAKTADPSTMNDWMNYFNSDSTEYAGGVWTDKSVFTDASAFTTNGISLKNQDYFLIALSAMASNMTIEGMEYSPSDTVFVLDVSGSMSGNSAFSMVNAANASIAKLLKDAKYNRIGVILYSGDNATEMLPIGRYTSATSTFLSINNSGNSISTSADAYIEGTSTRVSSKSVSVTGATYIQSGIINAIDAFLDESGNTQVTDPVLGTLSRIPVFVLMSDGAPTRGTYNFQDPGDYEFGNGNDTTDNLGFVTQLSLAYAKQKLQNAYNTDSVLLYTIGLGVSNDAIANCVLDPSKSTATINDLWERYNNAAVGSDVVIDTTTENVFIGNPFNPFDYLDPDNYEQQTIEYTVKKVAGLSKNYTDKHIAVSGTNNNELLNAFDDIVKQIQLKSKFHPTLVEGSENLSGYVSFVDKLGKYMEVKDIKGLLINNVLHTGETFAKHLIEHHSNGNMSLDPNDVCYGFIDSVVKRLDIPQSMAVDLVAVAIAHGQLAYNASNGTFSNYIGWFSDANGRFLGPWYEGITTTPGTATHINRSYGFFGDTNASLAINDHDMLYATIRVREEIATGFESVAFAVPASLIPTLTYNVSLNESGDPTKITTTGDNFPIRLVYEVGLDDEINEITVKSLVTDTEYLAQHVTADGYEFYTNRFDHNSNIVAYGTNNTYSYFTPSKENERYYYLSDSPVCIDTNGTPYTDDSAPAENGTYYRAVTVYEKVGARFSKDTIYEQIMPHALSRQNGSPKYLEKKSDGIWYVKAGTAHNYVKGLEVKKANGTSVNSVEYSYHPFVDAHNGYVVGAILGNNGRLVVTPATGIKVTKTVEKVNVQAPTSFKFVVTNKTNTSDSNIYKTYHVNANGVVTENIIAFVNGEASFNLQDKEKFYISGLTPGHVFTVTEEETAHYFCQQNNIDLTVVSQSLATADFINSAKGTGNLTVAKEVDHNFGTSYQIPANKTFNFEITLEGIGVTGQTFEAKHSGNANISNVTVGNNGKITLTLKHLEEFTIYNLPEGTKATVEELAPGAGFSPLYYENDVLGDGKITVQKDIFNVVNVINDYAPTKVDPVNITVSGTKTLEGIAWQADHEFFFDLQKLNPDGTTWTTLDTASVKGSNASKTFSFTDVFSSAVYDKAGIYYYRITEQEGTAIGMNYDRTVHAFAVIVGDADMDGKLEITEVRPERETVTVNFSGSSWNVTAGFTNTHNPSETTASINITKIVTDGKDNPLDISAGFKFELYENGTLVKTSEPTTNRGFTRLNIPFTAVGEHTYTLKEIIPTSNTEGWIYDTKEVVIKIKVTADTEKGILVADINETGKDSIDVSFTNKYAPEAISVPLDVRKSLEGRDLIAGEFSFEIREVNSTNNAITGTNNEEGKVTFEDSLIFDKAGVYYYDVVETSVDGKGVVTDKNVYRVIIIVVDNNGTLSASYTVENSAENYIEFKNTYTAKPATYTVIGKKDLKGKELLHAEFNFTLAVSDKDGNVASDAKIYTAANNVDGSFSFPELTFEKAGDYYFVVTENTEHVIPNVTYDSTKYIVKITVTDEDLDGQLEAAYSVIKTEAGVAATEILFTNVYTPNPASGTVFGKKVFIQNIAGNNTSRAFAAGDFTFNLHLSDENWNTGELYDSVDNEADGTFSFTNFTFEKEGTYYYLVKESLGGTTSGGIMYDNAVYRVKIVVEDNKQGELIATVHLYNSNNVPVSIATFTNFYILTDSDSVVISGKKNLENKTLEAGQFEFVLTETTDPSNPKVLGTVTHNANGEFSFEAIKYIAPGTYTYKVTEVQGSLERVTYDKTEYTVTVEVTDNGEGKLVATVTGADNIIFTNRYTPQKVDNVEVRLSGKKQLIGRFIMAGEFQFILEGEGVTETAKVKIDGSFEFNSIYYTVPGKYYYTVREIKGDLAGITYDETVYRITVEIFENSVGKLTANVIGADNIVFTNTYNASEGEVIFSGKKVLSGRPINEGEFSFIINEIGTDYTETVTVKADGTFEFSPIKYNSTGIYNYTIAEVKGNLGGVNYDSKVYTIAVIVTDQTSLGKLVAKVQYTDPIVFYNTYSVKKATANISGSKILSGRDLTAGEYSFVLTEVGGNYIQTVQNRADGRFSFSTLTFNKPGTYTYTVKEVNGSLPGVRYDETVYNVTITVTDNGNGSLVARVSGADRIIFRNTYTPASTTVTLGGTKQLIGRPIAAGEFEFILKGKGVSETVKVNEDGSFSFTELTFDKAGTYSYTVEEVKGSLAGIKYDQTVYNVTVIVTDDGNGNLVAAIENNDIVFTNRVIDPAEVTFEGINYLDLVLSGGFNFVMKEGESIIANATSDENGYFNFGTLVYNREGTYTYTISEIEGDNENIIYDTNIFTVTVTVTIEGDEFKANVKTDALIPLENAKLDRSKVTTADIEFYNWTIPEETTEIPEETTVVPEETTTPEETTVVPEETTTPEETTIVPEETTEVPEDTTETPNPETGDTSSVVIWFGAIIVAFCATAGALFSKKREIESDNE